MTTRPPAESAATSAPEPAGPVQPVQRLARTRIPWWGLIAALVSGAAGGLEVAYGYISDSSSHQPIDSSSGAAGWAFLIFSILMAVSWALFASARLGYGFKALSRAASVMVWPIALADVWLISSAISQNVRLRQESPAFFSYEYPADGTSSLNQETGTPAFIGLILLAAALVWITIGHSKARKTSDLHTSDGPNTDGSSATP